MKCYITFVKKGFVHIIDGVQRRMSTKFQMVTGGQPLNTTKGSNP